MTSEISIIGNIKSVITKGSPILSENEEVIGIFDSFMNTHNLSEGYMLNTSSVYAWLGNAELNEAQRALVKQISQYHSIKVPEQNVKPRSEPAIV
jgi:hypothetical protein